MIFINVIGVIKINIATYFKAIFVIISHAVYNMRFLKPIDEEMLNEIFSKFAKIVVVEDHIDTGGLSSIIREFAWKNGKDKKIIFMNLRNNFFRPGNFSDAIQNTELTIGKIIAKVTDS